MSSALNSNHPVLTKVDFEKISRLAHDHFGLELPEGKEGLVSARLGKKIRQGGFTSFAEYYRNVIEDRTGAAMTELVDALTTNFTSFLREPAHFEFLRKMVTTTFRSESTLRVWSSACSTGEEAYTIAMVLSDEAQDCKWAHNIEIIATDISTRVLKHAQEAVYAEDRFRGVPEQWRRNYLLKGSGAKDGFFKIKPAISHHVRFEQLNLIAPFPQRRFQFIFCRNVMIYFNHRIQQHIVSRLTTCLEPGGYLFIGHSESLNAIQHRLRYVRPSIYRNEAK